MSNEGMTAYTKWCVKYPWHVSEEPVPDDCGCEYCTKERNIVADRIVRGLPINPHKK